MPKAERPALPLATTINKLFGIQLSRHEKLKNSINSLIRNKTIEHTKEPGVQRAKTLVYRDQLDTLFNAVVLQGLFSDPKVIKKILTDTKGTDRQQAAKIARTVLVDRQSIADISLLRYESIAFVEMLENDKSLSEHRLPNPFETLPQLVLPERMSALQVFLAQHASLSSGDTMMAHYLNGDLEAARQAAQALVSESPKLVKYKELIEREYREAKEFDDLLDFLK